MNKSKPSLYLILSLVLCITVILSMTIHATYSYIMTKEKLSADMRQETKRTIESVHDNIANFIASYEVHEYEKLVQTEMRHGSALAIIIHDDNMAKILGQSDYIFGMIRNDDWQLVGFEPNNPAHQAILNHSYYSEHYKVKNLMHEEVGTLSIYTSDKFLNQELNKIIYSNIISTFLTVILLILLQFFTLRRFVFSPISQMARSLKQVDDDGIPTQNMPDCGAREVCTLSMTINNMLSSIKFSQRKLQEHHDQLQLSASVFEQSRDGFTITDANRRIIDVNPSFSRITGFEREEVIGQDPRLLSSGKQPPQFYDDMWKQLDEKGSWQGEVWNRKKNGEEYIELLTISVLRDRNGHVVNYVGVFTDITDNKKQQEKLERMAHFDVLTGLPNRALFTDRFQQAIAHSKRNHTELAVCFLDLDNFKPVNDLYGHDIGDRLLIEVSSRLAFLIREEDTVSRQGGDEFTILLNDIASLAQCESTVKRILHEISKPYLIDGIEHHITASTGITLYPSDKSDIDTLVRHADQAMYQAKLNGRDRFELYNPENDLRTINKQKQIEEIELALTNNEFELYYQPKLDVATGTVYGVEALIRWIHPEKGVISPYFFLPVIEGSETELLVGDWVVHQALSQLNTWHEVGILIQVSINVSSNQILSGDFIDKLDSALALYPDVDSQYLQLEVLESSAFSEINAISHIIKRSQQLLGVKVALDDFGTGHSSLTHLRQLSADVIKIDQSFIRDMIADPSDYVLVDGVIKLAESFHRESIAEGVETIELGLMLLLMGCTKLQGYAIAKPMPVEAFSTWLDEYVPDERWLALANKTLSESDKQALITQLTIENWLEQIEKQLEADDTTTPQWPITNKKRCHCGLWIQRLGKVSAENQSAIKAIKTVHTTTHELAEKIITLYLSGDKPAAREALSVLQANVKELISELLRLYNQN